MILTPSYAFRGCDSKAVLCQLELARALFAACIACAPQGQCNPNTSSCCSHQAAHGASTHQISTVRITCNIPCSELDVVPPLAALLSVPDLQAQVCAAGALLNIVGPELDQRPMGQRQRRGFGHMLSLIMATAVVHECLFEKRPHLE